MRLGIWGPLQLQAKCMKESKQIEQNLTRGEDSNICFCVIFDRYYQMFIFGIENRL